MTCPGRQLGINGVRCAKEHPENMAAQRAARRFDMVMPAGNAAHMEARVAFGLGKPCYAVGPVGRRGSPPGGSSRCSAATLGRTIGLVHGLH